MRGIAKDEGEVENAHCTPFAYLRTETQNSAEHEPRVTAEAPPHLFGLDGHAACVWRGDQPCSGAAVV